MIIVALCIHLLFLCAKVQQKNDIRKHTSHFSLNLGLFELLPAKNAEKSHYFAQKLAGIGNISYLCSGF